MQVHHVIGLIFAVSMMVLFVEAQEQGARNQWTWLHRKQLSAQEQELNKLKKEIAFAKKDVPPFSQLIFSWNSFRPQSGHFTFYAQVRDSKTKKWSKWHKMICWGTDIQKSFKSQADTFSSYHHVRLESASDMFADGFAIKIEAHDSADLSLIKGFAINLSNFSNFIAEKEMLMHDCNSVYIKGVPMLSQFEINHPRNNGLCSPTSCTMLMGYLLSKTVDPIEFAQHCLDSGLDKYGSWPFNMAHAFEKAHGKISFAVTRCNSFKNLYDRLRCGIPVVVSVRGHMTGAPKVYTHGHLLVVIGYDAKTKEVICHDPAMPEAALVKKRYPLKDFMQAWERSHRLAYIAEPIT